MPLTGISAEKFPFFKKRFSFLNRSVSRSKKAGFDFFYFMARITETDIQSLNWDESEAEAEVVAAKIRPVAAPGRRTAVLRAAAPTAATAHAVRAG